MRKIEPEFITGMGYIGASPGVLYHMGGTGEQTVVTGNPALLEGGQRKPLHLPHPPRQIITKKHDWGAVNIIKRFLWSNNNKRSNKNPNWNFGMGTRRDLKRECTILSLFFADFS